MTKSETHKLVNWAVWITYLILLLSLTACQQKKQLEETLKDVSASSEIEGSLVLKNATLEQSDNEGNTLWKIQAKEAIYSDDKETAKLKELKGHLFRDGKIVLQVTANQGEILEDGQKILLRENIVATDPRNKAVIRGEEVEWIPEEDVLIVNKEMTGDHPQLRTSADKGKYFTGEEHLELRGQIVATTKDPPLQMKTEYLSWRIAQKKVSGNQKIQIDRYEKNTVTDRVVGDKSEVNLGTKIAVLENNVELKSLEPRLQIATNLAIWDTKKRTVQSPQPVQIVHPEEEITLTANQGIADLEKKTVELKGGVRGLSLTNKGDLYGDQLNWDITTQIVKAQGNVIYQQADPKFNLTGETAVGRLQDQSIVVDSGDNGKQVVTEIIP